MWPHMGVCDWCDVPIGHQWEYASGFTYKTFDIFWHIISLNVRVT